MKQAGLQLDLPFPYILLNHSSILQYSFSPPPSFFFLITRFSFILYFCVCASSEHVAPPSLLRWVETEKTGEKGERGTQFSSKLSQSQSQSQRVISSKPRNERRKEREDWTLPLALASPRRPAYFVCKPCLRVTRSTNSTHNREREREGERKGEREKARITKKKEREREALLHLGLSMLTPRSGVD